MRSSTTSSSSLRVGAGPVARSAASRPAPRRGAEALERGEQGLRGGEAERLGLTDGAAEGLGLEVGGEVDEGAGGRGQWQLVVVDDVLRFEDGRAVDADAGVVAAGDGVDGDFGVAVVPREEAVDGGSGEVAEHGGRSAGHDGREEAPIARGVGVADGVDAAVEWMEVALGHADADRAAGQTAGIEEVVERDDAPLAGGELSEAGVGSRLRHRRVTMRPREARNNARSRRNRDFRLRAVGLPRQTCQTDRSAQRAPLK
jgi:hypothetical protein